MALAITPFPRAPRVPGAPFEVLVGPRLRDLFTSMSKQMFKHTSNMPTHALADVLTHVHM